MPRWQKRARVILAVLLLALVAAVFIAVRARRAPDAVRAVPPRIDPKAIVESHGGEYTHTRDGRAVFTVTFDRQLTYPDGRTALRGVEVRIPDRQGKTFLITSQEARQATEAGRPLGRITFEGSVTLTSTDGLRVETPSAGYDESSAIVRAPGQVTFARGRLTGSGVGATYDERGGVLAIVSQTHVTVLPDSAGADALEVTSTAAELRRPDRVITFSGGVTLASGAQSAQAERATAYLAKEEDRLERLHLSGGASIAGAGGSSTLQNMRAGQILLTYGDDGRSLRRASLEGDADVDLAAAGGATRTLSAKIIDASLGPAGALTALDASDNVVLVMPGDARTPARRIESATLAGRGDESGLRTLSFGDGVIFRETQGSPAIDRRVRATALDVALKPGFGTAEDARFRGMTLQDGAVRADAPEARYWLERGVVRLTAQPGRPEPRVLDDRISIDAREIELTVGGRRVHAKETVRSVLQPRKAAAAGDERRLPVMLKGDEPVNLTAADLMYDGDAGRATYTGGARLWQGETSIQGDSLTLDDKQGNLTVIGNALSRMPLERKGSDSAAASGTAPQEAAVGTREATLARADTLTYDNAARKATYEGHAHVTGPEGDVSADRIELYLDESGRAIARAEAYTNVTARFEEGHRATGARLTYLADGERYAMAGTPVNILEKLKDGCRETVGAALTFVRSTDTIGIVGSEGSRSRTTPGSCAGLR